MKKEKLYDGITDIREDIIERAENYQFKKNTHRRAWIKWGSLAACLCLVVGLGLYSYNNMGVSLESDTESPAESGAGGSGHSEGTVFMSYAGPVFPLTVMEQDSALEAERTVTMDFSTYENIGEEAYGMAGGIYVWDSYELVNTSEQEASFVAVYPVSGDFQTTEWPVIRVDGAQVSWELHAGAYTGGFTGAGDEYSSSLNLEEITFWEGYQELLSDGTYQENAFAESVALNQPVTVYKLTDLTDGGYGDAVTLCMSFTYDNERTQIYTYGFNGAGVNEWTGEEYRDFFIREGRRKPDEDTKYLIVAGDDLAGYTLQGYQDGSCTPGEEIEGAGATVTRVEATMGEALKEIAQLRYQELRGNEFDGDHNRYVNERIDFDMYYQEICEFFALYGPGGEEPKERYEYGMLDDIVDEAAYHERILYLTFPLTIPAGGSVSVEVEQYKAGSYDYACSGSENIGVEGYDMVTELGSSLSFTRQQAAIENYGGIEIVRQNFGFDIKNGVTQVELAMKEPHYYLEVRKVRDDSE